MAAEIRGMLFENFTAAVEPSASDAAVAAQVLVLPSDAGAEVEEEFFRRGMAEDQAARQQLRQRLAAMPRWPGLGWAIALVALSVIIAALLLTVPLPS